MIIREKLTIILQRVQIQLGDFPIRGENINDVDVAVHQGVIGQRVPHGPYVSQPQAIVPTQPGPAVITL